MANVIKLKRGTSTPTTSDIVDGEVAIDTSAKKLYVNDGSTIKEIGGGGGGGGALEFVSKTTVSSSVSQVDFTSLADDSRYLLVSKSVNLSASVWLNIYFFDGSNNLESGSLQYRRDLTSLLTAASGADFFNGYGGTCNRWSIVLEISTKADENMVLYRGAGNPTGAVLGSISYDSSHTSVRIGGIRLSPQSGTIDSGSQFLLYKYKES